MDVVNGVLNWAAMPAMVATLLLFYPPYYLFKLCYSFLSYLFPDDLKRKVVLITGASSGIDEGGGGAVVRWMLPTQTVCNMGESISGRPKHDHDRPTAAGRPWKA